MGKVLYDGKVWEYEELPASVRARLDKSRRERDIDGYIAQKSLETHTKLLDEQDHGWESPREYQASKARARRLRWRGCSPEMNR